MLKHNKEIARQAFEKVLSKGNLDLVDTLVADDYVGHSPLEVSHGPEDVKQFVTMLRNAFPDMEVTVEDQVADGDKVATRWTCRGTHKGEFQGMAPTGEEITMTGISMFRMANGKIVEEWAIPDMLGVLQQVGAVPEPEMS
jgi:steroid delta-isomerase-like uncharacterized protein